ncbi:hypothetical protein Tco_0466474 [Tanacetum coccineum]
MTTSKLPSLIDIRSILKGWFNKALPDGHCWWWSFGTDLHNALSPKHDHITVILSVDRLFQWLSAFLTQGTVSSISIIFSWGGSISPEGFLSSVLLWLVIIVAVVGVGVNQSVLLLSDPLASGLVMASYLASLVGHKVANSWNLLTYVLKSFLHNQMVGAKEFKKIELYSVKVPVAKLHLKSSIQL